MSGRRFGGGDVWRSLDDRKVLREGGEVGRVEVAIEGLECSLAGALVHADLCPETGVMHGVGRFSDSILEMAAINLEYFEIVDGGVFFENSPEILNKVVNSSVIKKGDILGKLLQPIIDVQSIGYFASIQVAQRDVILSCMETPCSNVVGNMQVALSDARAVNRAAEDG
ncbi:hypothetical protein V6N13_135975 [Hibiscus sabdariffa]|uniref:Uncharacterized protein n=1 Tax=Hibiscus sabdariffa TaxID=183260 RepID=A0ABR2AJ90_9ROSI